MVVVATTTALTKPRFRELGVLDPRWVVEDHRTLRAVVRQRIETAEEKKKEE